MNPYTNLDLTEISDGLTQTVIYLRRSFERTIPANLTEDRMERIKDEHHRKKSSAIFNHRGCLRCDPIGFFTGATNRLSTCLQLQADGREFENSVYALAGSFRSRPHPVVYYATDQSQFEAGVKRY